MERGLSKKVLTKNGAQVKLFDLTGENFKMIIRKLTALTAAIFLVTICKVEAKPSLATEFCGNRYCGYHQTYNWSYKSHHKKRVKKQRIPSIIVAHQEKSVEPSIPLPKPKPLISGLVAEARKYLGTNPTGWHSVWCGRFMGMIVAKVSPTAIKKVGNVNLAINWARLSKVAPRIGAILVTRRSGGSHVGVVIGFNKNGDPITISGNHGRKVGIGTYHKSRIVAYVAA